jgi:hypothetical protein
MGGPQQGLYLAVSAAADPAAAAAAGPPQSACTFASPSSGPAGRGLRLDRLLLGPRRGQHRRRAFFITTAAAGPAAAHGIPLAPASARAASTARLALARPALAEPPAQAKPKRERERPLAEPVGVRAAHAQPAAERGPAADVAVRRAGGRSRADRRTRHPCPPGGAERRHAPHAHAQKVYFSGPLVRRVERTPDGAKPAKDDGWLDVWAQLGGTTLSVWDMRAIEEASRQGKEVPPTYVNVTDAVSTLGPAVPRNSY